MGSVRVAIVGVGNCASSLVQGVEYYRNADPNDRVPGLMHVDLRRLPRLATWSSSPRSTWTPRRSAWTSPRRSSPARTTPSSSATCRRPASPSSAARPSTVSASTTARSIEESDEPSRSTSSQALRDAQVDVVVSYLPVGSEEADKFYAQAAIDAGCAFVNALPVFIASDPVWAQKFTDAGLPIVGDDIKSQVGATIVHRALAKLFEDRGVELLRTYQLNFGGNMDFMNMLERNRLVSKKISKTQSVTSQIPHEMAKSDVHIGPSDHVPWLDDRKWAYIRLEGRSFGDTPLNAELKLEVWDSPNSAGVIIDAVRAAKIALDRKHRRPDPVGVALLHEVAAGAVRRPRRARGRRGVHQGRRSSADRARSARPSRAVAGPRRGRPFARPAGRPATAGSAQPVSQPRSAPKVRSMRPAPPAPAGIACGRRPPPKPTSLPPAPTTRWHGTITGSGLRLQAVPTARAAPGSPSAVAISP